MTDLQNYYLYWKGQPVMTSPLHHHKLFPQILLADKQGLSLTTSLAKCPILQKVVDRDKAAFPVTHNEKSY